MLRRQPPAHSPLTARALARGLAGLFTGRDRPRRQLRSLIVDRYACRDLLLTDSGTSALRLALEAAPGPVALPAYSCFDVATAADGADASVLLYDLDPETLGPDPGSLAAALDAGAGAVVFAPLYGVPVDLGALDELSRDAGVLVVEDAAQGVGARGTDGRPVGASGSLSVVSFGRGKGRTGGGGGALLALDEEGHSRLSGVEDRLERPPRGAVDLLRAAGQWLFGRPTLFGAAAAVPFLHVGETVYHPPWPPSGASAASLAVVTAVWGEADRESSRRRKMARRLGETARGVPGLEPIAPPAGSEAGYLRLPVLCASAGLRNRLCAPGGRRLGIMPGYPRPLRELPGFRDRVRNSEAEMPGARTLCDRLLTLPTHGRIGPNDLQKLETWVRSRA